MRRSLLGMTGLLLALSPVVGSVAAQADDTELTISHVEPTEAGVNILVSVPKGTEVDYDTVAVTLDGNAAESKAAPAGDDPKNRVKRTTILAIDTSNSMRGTRLAAAKSAATTFIAGLPEDVFLGIVTFDGQVRTALAPTLDKAAATQVVEGLGLALGTLLNDGVIAATKLAGTEGQRSVLVLSDGLNTNATPLAAVEKAIKDSEVKVDAVALDQAGDDIRPLQAMTLAGNGALISSDPAALSAAFAAEADSLARQVLISAEIPSQITGSEATIEVTVPSGDSELTAKSFTIVRGEIDEAPVIEVPRASTDEGIQIPKEAMYGGIAALGVGMLILLVSLMSMATGGSAPKTVEQRIAAYAGGGAPAHAGERRQDSNFNLDQAKDAAASMLHRNKGLEARIEQRLEAAGSQFKAAEWLLLHGAIVILGGLAGLLLGNGSLLLLFAGMLVAAWIPWLWLGKRRTRRINKFNTGLADTLQLISGSLSAGMSLAQSLDAVVNEGNEPIAGEFKRVLIETRLGVPLEAALEGIAQRVESKDFAWVVMAIRIQREVGGNLAELLTTVASTLRERDYLRRQVKSLSAEGRLSAYILIALPIVVLGYLLSFRREYVEPLYTEPMGFVLIFVAVMLMVIGWFTMSRIVKVEV